MEIDTTRYSIQEMQDVNSGSLRCDGIDEIDENGIHFTDDVIKKMRIIFGIEYPRTIALEDCEKFSIQIADKLLKYKK